MAGDWIKMRVDLAVDPAVIAIASATSLDEFSVVGRLHLVWSWADQHTRDGNAPCVTEKWLDRYVGATGFAAAMQSAGWLRITEHGLTIPSFDKHNGQSGKTRGLTLKRVQKNRNAPTVTESLPEKNREEKSIKGVNPLKPPAVAVAIPEELQTVEFDKAWSEWLAYRRERKHKTTERTQRGMLDRLADWGSAIAVQAINDSICNGWQGLFDPRERTRGSPSHPGSQSRHSANDIIEDF